jgi:outer membrane protein
MMRAFRTVLAGMGLFVVHAAAGAQTPHDLTPEESVRLGLQRNARLDVARAEAAEAEAVRREVEGARLPGVRAQASYTRLGGHIPEAEFTLPGLDTTFTLLPVELNRYHSELSVEQPLYTGGRLSNQLRAAEHQVEAARLRVVGEEASVAFQVRQAYWGLAAAIEVRDALDAALLAVEEHVRNVRSRVEDGVALTADLLAAQTRYSEVLLERVAAENAVRVGQLELNRLTGLPLATPVRPVGTVAVEPLVTELSDWVTETLREPPAIGALQEQASALRAQVAVAQGARYPEVALVGRYLYSRPNPYAIMEQTEFRGTWEAGVVLQWRLWEGGQQAARTAGARARLAGAESLLLEAREQAEVEATRQYLEVRRATEAVEVAALTVGEAEETLRVVRQQFAEGAALSAQVLEAEQVLRTAQTRRATALSDYAVARAALLFAEGRVW